MIEIKNLVKHYGEIKAVDGVSFSIREGEITGFLGPNGAGKSTTLKMITGYLKQDSGNIFINNQDINEHDMEDYDFRRDIGYLPETNPLYQDMLVYDFLHYIARIKEVNYTEIDQRILFVADKCSIRDRLSQPIGTLSKGLKQRVGLAQTIINDPKILILDEPTVGLDPNQILDIRALIKELGKEKTVILSSHILQEVQAVCDRIIIINQGKIVADTTKEQLLNQISNKHVIHLIVNQEISRDILNELGNQFSVQEQNKLTNSHKYILECISKSDISVENNYELQEKIFDTLSKFNIKIYEFYVEVKKLEEVFHLLTK